MKKRLSSLSDKLPIRQFVKFNMVGVANTAIDFILFAVLNGVGMYYAAAQTLSYLAGLLNSFLLNKHWTFLHRRSSSFKEIAAFCLVNLASLACSILLIFLLHDRLRLPVLLAKLIATVFTVAVNFFGYRRWVFVEGRRNKEQG